MTIGIEERLVVIIPMKLQIVSASSVTTMNLIKIFQIRISLVSKPWKAVY